MQGRVRVLMFWIGIALFQFAAPFCAAGDGTPVKIVRVDLGSGVFDDWLPFDEPFVIKGAVPVMFDSVLVSFAKAPRQPQGPFQGKSRDPLSRRRLGRVSVWHRTEGLPGDSFAVRMPALEHSTAYDFQVTFVRRLSDGELGQFQEQAAGIVDTMLRAVPGEGLSPDELEALRARLRVQVTPHGYDLASTGFLAGGTLETALQLESILSPQADREMVLEDIQGRVGRLGELLEQAEAAEVAPTIIGPLRSAMRMAGSLTDAWTASEIRDGGLEEATTAVRDLIATERPAATDIASEIDRVLETLADDCQRLERSLDERSEAIDDAAEALRVLAADDVSVSGSTSGSFKTRAQQHVSQDFGLAWIPGVDDVLPFFGLNIYMRPVNRDVPPGGLDTRVAITVGVTLQSIAKPGERDDILKGVTPVLGAGLRLTEFTRISGGVVIFKADDPNPLVTDWDVVAEGYIALGLDVELKDLLQRFGNVFN